MSAGRSEDKQLSIPSSLSKDNNTSFPTNTIQSEHPLLASLLTSFGTGTLIGAGMVGPGYLLRSLQQKTEDRLTGRTLRPAKFHVSSLRVGFLTFTKLLFRGAQTGVIKNAAVSQRGHAVDIVNGEHSFNGISPDQLIGDVVGSDIAEFKNKELTLKQAFCASLIVSGGDALVMNPFSNKQFWTNMALQRSDFTFPKTTTFIQKRNLYTTGITMRFIKNIPSIFGLMSQPYLKAKVLPSHLSDGEKDCVVSFCSAAFTTPISVMLDSFHSFQLASVDKLTVKAPSISEIFRQYGYSAFKFSPATLAGAFTINWILQYAIPKVTQYVENNATPSILKKGFFAVDAVKQHLNSSASAESVESNVTKKNKPTRPG